MQAEIITIGDELLIGQTINTNSAWIGEQLELIGVKVYQATTISDNETHIINALNNAKRRVNLIIITGGLGPTKDDITKHTLCKYFDTELTLNRQVLSFLEKKYAELNLPFDETSKAQALLPKNCTVLPNTRGTASGMWFEKDNIVYISLPGVPYEMKGILTDEGFPKIKQHFTTEKVIHKTVKTVGVVESKIAKILTDWENELQQNNLKLAYLPSPGFVRLRISGIDKSGHLELYIEKKLNELKKLIGDYIYGYENDTLEKIVGELLLQKNKTVATAESCTGGTIAQLITSVSGSSAYYKGSIVAYDNAIKINVLNVLKPSIDKNGAVSQEVVEQMAINALSLLQTDYAIATSGIAGPTGGTEEKPVGTVWIAIASKQKVVSKVYHLSYNNRKRNIQVAANYALNMLRKVLLNEF